MGEDHPGLRLRELTPADGPAIARLADASPDTGMVRFKPSFQIDPFVALTYDERQTGVVVERDGSAGLVGIGLLEIGEMVLRGHPTPFALLHSLAVRPDARRQGVATAIIDWRLARAREMLGDGAVIAATIQKNNAGSFAAASRWATQFSGPLASVVIGLPASAPTSRDGFRARPARADDLEGFANGYAGFHAEFDLWPPATVPDLVTWLDESPVAGVPINALWVGEDESGHVVAGLGTSEVRKMSILQVEAVPPPMRVINAVIRVIPKGGSMEIVRVSRMWFQPGAEAAARHLFETVRWEAREQGNVVIASFDPRGPLARMIAAPRWLPRTQFSLALRATDELRPDRPIAPVQ